MRDAVNNAKNAFQTSNSTAGTELANAGQIAGSLIPGLEREAQTPTGYTPEQENSMLVAGEQGAGGTESGIKGAANSEVARSRNSAGYSNVLDEAARDKMRTNAASALGVKNRSADIGLKRQAQAQEQLGSLYGEDTNAGLKAESLLPEDVNAETNASKVGWLQNMNELIRTLSARPGVGG